MALCCILMLFKIKDFKVILKNSEIKYMYKCNVVVKSRQFWVVQNLKMALKKAKILIITNSISFVQVC